VLDIKQQPVFKAELILPRVITNEEELRRMQKYKRTIDKVDNSNNNNENDDNTTMSKKMRPLTPPIHRQNQQHLFEDIDNIILQMAGKASF